MKQNAGHVLISDVYIEKWKHESCVVVETPTELPYIDVVHSQLGVALGMNGVAAKSCDEIGRMASSMVLTGWDSDILQHNFALRTIPAGSGNTDKTKSML